MRIHILILLIITMIASELSGQIVYPVTVNSSLSSNGSVYLSDYTDDALNMLSVNMVFNDNNEPSWDVRLRLVIESSNVKIQSKASGTYTPITLYPGESMQLSGSELSEYFDYNNLESQGIAMSQLSQNGRLPEGTYSFCFEAVDYRSGKAISIRSCNITYVVLYDPPIVQTPNDESTITPQYPQNIVFQWQDGTPPSYGSSQNTEYILRLYEVTNNQISPKAALINNQVINVYTSVEQASTTLIYDASLPTLDDNKRYVFTVQAVDINNRDVFKNDGLSEPSWFSYGYSTGGNISLTSPPDNDAFTKSQQKLFEWSAPSNLSSGQNYTYEFTISKINSGQSKQDAIDNNTELHTELTNETSSQGGWSYILQEEMEAAEDYAWQVKAFSGTTEIAASEINKITGPPFIEKFIAGKHEVIVRQAYNSDINSFAGNGDIKFNDNGDVANIDFSGLKLVKSGERYVLEAGEISSKLNNIDITLEADFADNGEAKFKADSLKLNKDRLAVSGVVEWDLPLATTASDKAKIKSKYTWFNYDNYYISGNAVLEANTSFDLADPMNFNIRFDNQSDFLISKNKYILRLKGAVTLPSSLTAENENQELIIPFQTTNQLLYFSNNSCELSNKISIVDNVKLSISPTKVIFDFSDDESPAKLSSDASWKGIYVNEAKMIFLQSLDSNQVKLKDNFFYTFNTDGDNDFWIEAQGLHLNYEYNFPDQNQLKFNTFGGICKKLKLDINKNQVSSSVFEGEIEILILSASKLYEFEIPITESGFQTGDLKESLGGESFSTNTNNSQKRIDIEIGRAVFENHNHLKMTIDVAWTQQNIDLTNVSDFCVWGNSAIGFKSKNSMKALSSQSITNMDGGFEITIDSIGAGTYKGGYAFLFGASVAFGDDISGDNGPPSLTFVSDEPLHNRSGSIHTPGMEEGDRTDSGSSGSDGTSGDESGEVSSIADMIRARVELGLTSNEEGVILEPFIRINAVVAKFEGHLSIFYNSPDWGNGFHAYLYGKILLPIAVENYAHFVMGNYQGETYWFLGVSMQIGERANQYGDKFLTKMPDGTNKTLKSKKLGKLTGANTMKVGIPMGYVSLTGMEGRIYHHMSHTVSNTVIGENGYDDFDYRPDPDTDFGFLLRTSWIDTHTQGTIVMLTGALEATFGGGEGCRTIGLQGYFGFGNLMLPGGIINTSILEGTGTMTIDIVDDHVIAVADVNSGTPVLCAQGHLDMETSKNVFDINLGSPAEPVYYVPSCFGLALEGWMNLTKSDIFFGAGLRAQMEFNSPWIGIGEVARIKPYAGISIAAGMHTKLTWDPKFELNDIGLWVHANAGVYCKYEWLKKEGEWSLGKISLAGNFNVQLNPKPIIITGVLKGSVEILDTDIDFEIDGKHEL